MIREAFGLPDNLEPINILAVGYSNEETADPERHSQVTQGFLGLDREYECTVGAGANGGAINIHYEIAQQDTQ